MSQQNPSYELLLQHVREQSDLLASKLREGELEREDLEALLGIAVDVNAVQADLIEVMFQSYGKLQQAFEQLQHSFQQAGEVIDDYEHRLQKAAVTIAELEKSQGLNTLH
jgi:predicted  nucleic acid-binding Zn-ribbon protein